MTDTARSLRPAAAAAGLAALAILLYALAPWTRSAPAQSPEEAAASGAAASRLEISYLGNAGFLISDGEHTVLIDALFGEGLAGYPVVDEARRADLERAAAPFDEVDVVLATHHHGDHFAPDAVARHLSANPRALFLSTPQALDRLRAAVDDFAPLAQRAHGVLPPEGERHTVRLLGLDVTLLPLHHGRDRDPPVENVAFLFELGGRKLLHAGDTVVRVADLAPYDLASESIDVAMLPFWLLVYDDWEGVPERIAAGEILAMHVPAPDAPASYYSPFEDLESLDAAIRERYPGTRVFRSTGLDRIEVESAGDGG